MMLKFLVSCILFFVVVISPTGSYAAAESAAYKVKAAYLYNFAKFITWPEKAFSTPKSPLVIGVLGQDSFYSYLLPLAGKTVHNRPIIVQQFKTPADIKSCQILYLSNLNNRTINTLLSNFRNKAIVTVADQTSFAAQGGMIQLVNIRDRLRFIINKESADKHNIKIGSQLLALAIDVLETKP